MMLGRNNALVFNVKTTTITRNNRVSIMFISSVSYNGIRVENVTTFYLQQKSNQSERSYVSYA